MVRMDSQIKVIQPSGIIDSLNGGQIRREASDAIASGVKTILIDCQNVTFMDSSGLGALVMILKNVREIGGKLALCSIIDQIRMLLELTSMDNILEVFPNQESFNQQVSDR
jgi:anti-anti-sigma factor